MDVSLASYVYFLSSAGSFVSAFAILVVCRAGGRHVTLVGVSVFGAIASNVVQFALSVTFIFGQSAWVIAPLFIALGVGSGFFVGLFAHQFQKRSRWLEGVRSFYGG